MELFLIIGGLVVAILLTHHLTGGDEDEPPRNRHARGRRQEPTINHASTPPREAHGAGLTRWRETPGQSGPSGNYPITLLYQDSDGDESERAITLKQLRMKMGYLYLEAYCHTRAAPRTFRADRIVALTDRTAGEVIGDDVQRWLVDRYGPVEGGNGTRAALTRRPRRDHTPPRQGGGAMKAIWITAAVLAVLYFIGKDEGDSFSAADVRNSAAQKYTDSRDKRDFARILIGASGHTCGTVVVVGSPVDVGLTIQVLARCDTGRLYALGLSWTDASAQAVDCRKEAATVCP